MWAVTAWKMIVKYRWAVLIFLAFIIGLLLRSRKVRKPTDYVAEAEKEVEEAKKAIKAMTREQKIKWGSLLWGK